FALGDYQPLEIGAGRHADRLCAFARHHDGEVLVAAVPRLTYGLFRDGAMPDWGTTEIALPQAQGWRNVFTGAAARGSDRLPAAKLFRDFPVAVLIGHLSA